METLTFGTLAFCYGHLCSDKMRSWFPREKVGGYPESPPLAPGRQPARTRRASPIIQVWTGQLEMLRCRRTLSYTAEFNGSSSPTLRRADQLRRLRALTWSGTGYRPGCSTGCGCRWKARCRRCGRRWRSGGTACGGGLLGPSGRSVIPLGGADGIRFIRRSGGWPLCETSWLDWKPT